MSGTSDMLDLFAEGGSRPASRPTFWCQKVGKEHSPYYPRPFASLRATCAVKRLGLCGKTHSSFALRSNRLPQVRARCCCTLRCNSQPQALAVAGGGKRGDTKCGNQDSFFTLLIAATAISDWARSPFRHKSGRPSAPVSARVSAPVARCSGCGHWHRRVPMLRALTCRRLSERSVQSTRSELGGTADGMA